VGIVAEGIKGMLPWLPFPRSLYGFRGDGMEKEEGVKWQRTKSVGARTWFQRWWGTNHLSSHSKEKRASPHAKIDLSKGGLCVAAFFLFGLGQCALQKSSKGCWLWRLVERGWEH